MVAIFSLRFLVSEPAPCDLDGDRAAGGDRRRIACDRSKAEDGAGARFLVSRGMGFAQGKKRAPRRCGIGGRGFSRPSARSARSRGRWCAPRNGRRGGKGTAGFQKKMKRIGGRDVSRQQLTMT